MLRLVTVEEVKDNWENYKIDLISASEATEGGGILTEGGSEEYLKGIYSRLMNPFNQCMHLWIENEDEYLLLTHIQTCEFTKRKTLVLFSLTRTKDVDKETVSQRYFDAYPVISEFAKKNKCLGIFGYSDLEYFARIAKQVEEAINQKIITRYQFYLPLTNN
tara:strand:+ start:70 stop:555 length:486 start_codon:yes stop_codon:yes gene_type:complete